MFRILTEAPDLTFRSSFIMPFPTLPTDGPGVTGLSDWAQENTVIHFILASELLGA